MWNSEPFVKNPRRKRVRREDELQLFDLLGCVGAVFDERCDDELVAVAGGDVEGGVSAPVLTINLRSYTHTHTQAYKSIIIHRSDIAEAILQTAKQVLFFYSFEDLYSSSWTTVEEQLII